MLMQVVLKTLLYKHQYSITNKAIQKKVVMFREVRVRALD